MLKYNYKNRLGRKFKYSLITQITLTIFKLKYNLPDRVLEDLFKIDHVTISHIVLRVSKLLSNLDLDTDTRNKFFVVDSTTIRIGKDKSNTTFSGYKHHHGIKFQLIINQENQIKHISHSYPSSYHDKRIFLSSYKSLSDKIDSTAKILGDKAYVGLEEFNVKTPSKKKELRYKSYPLKSKKDNKNLSKKRIKVEHVFAQLKSYNFTKM